jgi:hypothetical protein
VSKVGALLGRESAEEETPTKDLSLPASVTAPPATEMSKADLERSTADTAPLPQWAQVAKEQQAEGGAQGAASLADTIHENEVIEAVSKREFVEPEMETSLRDEPYTQMEETLNSYRVPEKSAVVVAAASGSSPLMGARMASATLSDEALLDLDDEVSPSRSAREADDFILDLQDEAFAMDDETLEEYEEELTAGGREAGAFNEAQMTNDEQRSDFAIVEEPSMLETATTPQIATESIEPQEAKPVAEPTASSAPAQPVGLITLSQLSPEVIDAIARRAVEQISERVVEEVAWEVVPELAELLIKRHLERERAQTP